MQCTFDKNRAAVNLFATAPDWGSGTYTNLLTNPSFEAASGTVEVYRNYALDPNGANPSGISTTAGIGMGHWAGTGNTASVSRNVDAPWSLSGKAYKATWSAVASPESGTIQVSGFKPWATTAGLHTIAVRVKASGVTLPSSKPASISEFGVGASLSAHGNITHSDGTQTLWATVNVADPATMMTNPRVDWYVSGLSVGAFVEYSMNDAYLGAYQPNRQWFSGSFSPDSDLTAAWTGTANASASTLTGAGIAGVTGGTGRALTQSSAHAKSGTKSLRIIRTGTGISDVQAGALVKTFTSADIGKTFTVAAICTIPTGYDAATDTIAGDRVSRGIYVLNRVSAGAYKQAPTTPGTHLLTFSFQIADTSSNLRLGGGGAVGQSVFWDAAILVEGALPVGVTYWDGANKPASIPGATNAWTGNPNASTSTLTIPAITSARIERLTNNTWETIRGGTPPSTGYVALADQEMPLNQIVRYRISGFSGETLVRRYELEVDTTLEGSCTFIKVAGKPNLSTCFDVPRDRYEMSSATQGGTYDVLGGGSIGISSAAGIAATRMTIQAVAKTDEAAHALEVLLESHRIVFLQPVGHRAYPEGWYYIESVSWGMRADGQKKEGRSFVFPVVRTSRPGGESAGVAGSSYRLSQSKYPTYADIPDELSYFELLQGA